MTADTSAPNIYQSIGVEPIINCRGTFTIIGGSVELPQVVEAMEAASGYFVQYDELAEAVGKRLAELTGADWGLVPAGCAAGLKHITAACVTGGNPEKLIRIPDLTGLEKTQVIIPRYARNSYDHAVRNIGVEIVMVETRAQLEAAINPKTAMIYITTGAGRPLSLEVIAEVAQPHAIPILADAAAENLTIPNVHLEKGATAVAYSGGKALCGPQCAGLVLGDKALLQSAWQFSSPHHGPGRDNKIGKEEIMGMLAAVEAWTTRDHDAEWQIWLGYLDCIAQRVKEIDSVTTQVTEREGLSNRAPTLTISWDPGVLHITGEEVAENFARNKPRIAVASGDQGGRTSIGITPSQMQPGNDLVVADRIQRILSEQRPPRSTKLPPPATDISGAWDLTIHYFSSTSQHRLFLEQEGNWIGGIHIGDFSQQPIAGVIEDDQVKMRSQMSRPGNSIPFLFSGAVNGDTISGFIHLGEYLNVDFTATRAQYKKAPTTVAIPGGAPLAT
ncbi:MAG: selenocysteine synthase [Candidatus Latescibacteria bacterium]|nr:selenocysteine synthase [Candidatus Latescibacterota bacterium]